MEKITAKEIAAALNMPVHTVYLCLCKNPGTISAKKVEAVRNYAEAVGYKNREKFVTFCKFMRKNGYTNAEIAKAAGCTVPTVRHAIGKQPAEYTAYSMVKAGEDRARKNAARRERAEALRKAEERKRLQKTLENLEKDKKETLEKMNDMQERFRIAYAQKYETYKGLVDMIEATERQIEEVA